jgi:LacI family transcriptional regulator
MPDFQRIAVILDLRNEHARGILRGIHAYTALDKPWTFQHLFPESLDADRLERLAHWKPTGVLTALMVGRLIEPLGRFGVPLVSAGPIVHAPWPQVVPDEQAIGRLAARHLWERGFRHFAAYGHGWFDATNLGPRLGAYMA